VAVNTIDKLQFLLFIMSYNLDFVQLIIKSVAMLQEFHLGV